MLHQWHKSYRAKEQKKLTKNTQLSDVVRLNFRHLKYARDTLATVVNGENWGQTITEEEVRKIADAGVETVSIVNTQDRIQHFVNVELQQLNAGVHKFRLYSNNAERSLKHKLKKHLGREKELFLDLKEVNDRLLLHIISFYRDAPYTYCIDKKNEAIHFNIIAS